MAVASNTPGLIDSDILIDSTRGFQPAAAFVASQQSGSGIQVSIITAMELVAGCRNSADLRRVRQFLRHVTVVPLEPVISQRALQMMEAYFLSHGLLIADALIAATALEQGLTLYTKNVRHYRMIPGLTIVRPY